jgi:hypothetical protein
VLHSMYCEDSLIRLLITGVEEENRDPFNYAQFDILNLCPKIDGDR